MRLRYDCPCTQDCTSRSATCRLSCQPYREYEQRRLAVYAERERNRKAGEFLTDNILKGRNKMVRKQAAPLQFKRGGKTRFG